MKIPKGEKLYSGKAKTVYDWDDDHVLVEFRDDITAFDAEKHDQVAGKGSVLPHPPPCRIGMCTLSDFSAEGAELFPVIQMYAGLAPDSRYCL